MKALGKGSIASFMEVALKIAAIVLWILLACVALAALAYAVLHGLIAAGVVSPDILSGGRGHVRGEGFEASFDTDSSLAWQVVTPALLSALVAIAGALVIVRRLLKLFESFRSGEPFRKENANHLRVIWITMTIVELSRYGILALTGLLVAAFGKPSGAEMTFKINVDLMPWASILVLIVLAEVFREGARLREEQELTI
ncbi:MAG: DUF2975 domain-containing protein [Hyphomonadaceae bacterium]|nr:DUF2975 domain-containing protein [Hyphomonadaceae bacterium]